VCPLPLARLEIDVTTGEHVRSDAGVETYDVAVDGDGVYVRVA
jgi:nitrite reductase/ring-hydroxylating ferredoxin subunit